LLKNKVYSKFVTTLSQEFVKSDIEQKRILNNLYWYTVEVGVCKENGVNRVYGATQISSFSEIQHSTSSLVELRPFSWKSMQLAEVKIDTLQNKLFVLSSFDHLAVLTEELESKKWLRLYSDGHR
jgi:phenylalanine-4-hydroxylase